MQSRLYLATEVGSLTNTLINTILCRKEIDQSIVENS